ncbi:dimethylaniline monooxygenase [N-oxide-forming] 5-like isoform X2 [Pelobates cultripes]|uniref:Flavin-containing monooxygenase n=1 Tax=Pelobates cultripes TaxID=61616 RepID=A0AAD1WIQ1_PELCU|nr:dimethylaniline monooxygenase [N-oxide-forming] 5-like isoform X2 [Pelobates cultripes]
MVRRYKNQHPTINDDLPNRIMSGSIQIRSNVKEFGENNVVFDDGTEEKDIHVVVFATGYSFSFSFCDESVLNVIDNEISLYKYIFPPHLEKNTLAVIGLVQPIGAIMPISELQSRLATRVFKGLVRLPSAESMLADVEQKKQAIKKQTEDLLRGIAALHFVVWAQYTQQEHNWQPAEMLLGEGEQA